MSATRLFRDAFRRFIPSWLSERTSNDRTVAYRVLWSLISPLDAIADALIDGMQAPFPGLGTPTALPLISESRGLIRGVGESEASWSARLVTFRDMWKRSGSAEAIVRRLWEYLPGHPMIRFVNRGGYWVTIDGSGTITTADQGGASRWDWDSVSNPSNTGWWDAWLIIYQPSYTPDPGLWGAPGDVYGETGYALGFTDAPNDQLRSIRNLIATWKRESTNLRCVVMAQNAADFDPLNGASRMPDGTWAQYSKIVLGVAVEARPTDLRYLDSER